jgi:hypothetical protein
MIKKISVLLGLLFSLGANAQTTYYVDYTGGNDSNTGTTPAAPIQTLSHLNSLNILPGDSVLFKRGETWRDQLLPKSGNATHRVYYGAYGNGANPLILGSQNKNSSSDWVLVTGNIWKCTTTYPGDIGNLIFDQEASVGVKKWSQGDLLQPDDFYYNLATGEVMIYSTQNPALQHSSIELAIRRHVVDHSNTSYTTFENLDIRYGAAHGFGGSNTAFLIIRNCDLAYIGGGDIRMDGSNIRFGNAIEFWSWAHDNTVEKCRIRDIYDTGVTNQNHTNTVVQRNITYQYNTIWNCGMAALEIWNRPATSQTKNIRFENNTCFNNGMGWGSQRPDYSGGGCIFWHNESVTDSIFIRNNIFYNNNRSAYFFEDPTGPDHITINYNTIYNQDVNDTVYWVYGTTVYTGNNFTNYQTTTNNDVQGMYADPQLMDAPMGNFRLTSASPCIDAGLYLGNNSDNENNPVPHNLVTDIGAFEYFQGMSLPESAENVHAFKIYPNPGNGIVNIQFQSNLNDQVSIIVYNSTGQLVYTTNQIQTTTGTNYQVMNFESFPAGLYFVQLQGSQVHTTMSYIKK